MRIQFSITGTVERYDTVWVDLPAVPREGENVDLPGIPVTSTYVRTVVWYAAPREGEPFVYIVLGPRRPHA